MSIRICRAVLILTAAVILVGCGCVRKTDSSFAESDASAENSSAAPSSAGQSEENSVSSSAASENSAQESEQPPQLSSTESSKQPAVSSAAEFSRSQIRLNVPEKVQETNYYCAVACLQMVLEYHGISASQSELASAMNTVPVTGTEYADLAREASKYIFGKEPQNSSEPGYRAVLWDRNAGNTQTRKQFESRAVSDLANKDPLFVSINPGVAYPGNVEGVHELVVYGADFNEQGKAERYYCIDPNYNERDAAYGGKKVFTADELWNAMNNNPEPGYVW